MPTQLGKPYLLSWRGDPPHMLKPDIPIWYRFLAIYGEPFINLYYDCQLGGPTLTREQQQDKMQVLWRDLLVKRADAIAELQHEVWIIEVSADPGLRAIGQLISYGALWATDPKIDKPVKLTLVARTIEQDLLYVAGLQGIEVFIV